MTYIFEQFLGQYRIKLDPAYGIDKHIISKGYWENHIAQFLLFWIKPGYVCVDVGANAGYHTIPMAGRAGANGKVFAFEPNELILPRLTENIDLNPEIKPVIIIKKMGLSDTSGELKVFQSGEDLGNAYLNPDYNEKYWNAGTKEDYKICKVERLDSVLGEQKVDLIKVDVEGMELEVLKGAEKILTLHNPTIIFETLVDTFDREKIKLTTDLLLQHGYLLFGLDVEAHKLIPVTFPSLQEDTIAIHRSKVIDAAEVLVNAALFLPAQMPNPGTESTITELIIVCINRREFYVKIKFLNGRELSWDTLLLKNMALELENKGGFGPVSIPFSSNAPEGFFSKDY